MGLVVFLLPQPTEGREDEGPEVVKDMARNESARKKMGREERRQRSRDSEKVMKMPVEHD